MAVPTVVCISHCLARGALTFRVITSRNMMCAKFAPPSKVGYSSRFSSKKVCLMFRLVFLFFPLGSKERLFAHLVNHDVVFECNTCMKKFYQREQLNAHVDLHRESLCPWEGCSKLLNHSSLSSHLRQHRIEVNSKCSICNKGKVFAIHSTLACQY